MAEDNQTGGRRNRQKSSGGKRNRRRYFRRKDDNKNRNSSSDKRKRNNENQRRARRNRRRRSGDSSDQNKVAPVINAIENDYVPPTSFFAYTHVVRSSDTRDSYEYRPERLASGSRTLEDFRIDLSPLFAENDTTAAESTTTESGEEPTEP